MFAAVPLGSLGDGVPRFSSGCRAVLDLLLRMLQVQDTLSLKEFVSQGMDGHQDCLSITMANTGNCLLLFRGFLRS